MSDATTAAELASRLEDEDLAVLDVRDAHAYRQGHIPGAANLPITEIDDAMLEEDWPAEIVLVDYTGDTADTAAPKIDARLDSRVSHLAGGMSNWDGDLVAEY